MLRWAAVIVAALVVAGAAFAWMRFAGSDAQAAPIRVSAKFDQLVRPTTGRAVLVVNGDDRRVIFRNFETRAAPDLYVWLVPGTGLGGDITGGTRLGRLKAVSGPQQYRIPAGVDAEPPLTVVIWCKYCRMPWGDAELTRRHTGAAPSTRTTAPAT